MAVAPDNEMNAGEDEAVEALCVDAEQFTATSLGD
jgi:hypothetical protein